MSIENYINTGRIVIESGIFGFSDNDRNTIETVLKVAYMSPTAKSMIDTWLSDNPTENIVINYDRGDFYAPSNTGELGIDLSYLDTLLYISNNGTAVKHMPITAIVHELVHALTDKLDDGVGTSFYAGNPAEYRGACVIHSNLIYSELAGLGIAQQNSYIAQARHGEHLTLGYEYTGGAAIDRSVVTNGDWSTASRGNSNDLLIGGSGVNVFYAGDGNDFLYGMGGIDQLYGGNGDDTLYGGTGNDLLVGGSGIDKLYGDEGDDKLDGGDDDDELYGGSGNDTLYGGAGNDSYFVGQGGCDIIYDSDKRGAVYYGGNKSQQLTGGFCEDNDTNSGPIVTYYAKTGSYSYTYNTLDAKLYINVGNKVIARIDNFQNGDLDIFLTKEPKKEDLNYARKMRSPLVLDLDGDGIETIGVANPVCYLRLLRQCPYVVMAWR